MKKIVKENSLEDRVLFIGDIPYEKMPDAFSGAYMQVFPTKDEGLGRIIIESGLCEVLTIAYRSGGIPEVIKSGENGILVEPGDIDGLAKSMAELLLDENKTKQIGKKARERYLNDPHYSPELIARRHLEIYRETAAKHATFRRIWSNIKGTLGVK
jgi:glycosyltransferase involved in cell wall biosynthesis